VTRHRRQQLILPSRQHLRRAVLAQLGKQRARERGDVAAGEQRRRGAHRQLIGPGDRKFEPEPFEGCAVVLGSSDLESLGASGIPTLAAVLAAAGPAPFIDVELKGEPVPGVIPVLEAARGTGLGRTVVSSFEPDTIAWIEARRPAWPRWLNAMDLAAPTLRLAVELGCRGLSVDWHAIDRAGMARAASAGLEVAAWTVRRRTTVARLERLGVVAICVEAAALDG